MYKDSNRIGLTVDDDELEAMIKAAAEKAESAVRTKGATRQQLDGREDMALKMLRSNLSLREQQKIWEATGIQTTAPSLRAYFKRYFPEEWAAYLARTARGQLKNRLLAEPVGAEKVEIEAFLLWKPAQPKVESNKEEAQPIAPQVEANNNKQEERSGKAVTRIPLDALAKSREERLKDMNDARQRISDEDK